MARFWVLMTFAATVLLSGLASMTEDRGAPVNFMATLPPQATMPAGAVQLPQDALPAGDRISQRSHERRNQRASAADNTPAQATRSSQQPTAAGMQAGAIVLANLVSTRPAEPLSVHRISTYPTSVVRVP